MFFPIRDDNPHTVTPYVTYGLISLCVLVFLWQLSLGDGRDAAAVFGLIPGHLFGTVRPEAGVFPLPAWMTIFTSMFLHGGWMHLLGNMLYLWIFGDNIEASLGHRRYLVFYLLCGVVAALSQSFAAPNSDVPMVGASGAIAGVLGAYLVLHPRSNIKVFVFLIIITTINVPAFIVLGIWFAGQLVSSAAADPSAPGVAFLAHIGGFVAGVVLVFFFRRRGVQVFEPAHTRAFVRDPRPLREVARRRGSVPDAGGNRRGPWG
jgi:membrane associated rhomboid family serine protease